MRSGSTLHPAVSVALKAFRGGSTRIGDQVGLTPKRFSRVRRFQALLSSIDGAHSVDWAALALRYGFSDQAHLGNDFREFAGVTPSASMSKRTDHRNHIPCDW
ncbi:MAG: helix-turn-helix domain-containing protein [Spirochaetes bacterium]|jgi:AraC-like DNA-binding protein|nr:helix-turn-helix domain-containing protein [Spirochaetota bacterium]